MALIKAASLQDVVIDPCVYWASSRRAAAVHIVVSVLIRGKTHSVVACVCSAWLTLCTLSLRFLGEKDSRARIDRVTVRIGGGRSLHGSVGRLVFSGRDFGRLHRRMML